MDFGPEKGVDLNASYAVTGQTRHWKPAVIQPNGYVDLTVMEWHTRQFLGHHGGIPAAESIAPIVTKSALLSAGLGFQGTGNAEGRPAQKKSDSYAISFADTRRRSPDITIENRGALRDSRYPGAGAAISPDLQA